MPYLIKLTINKGQVDEYSGFFGDWRRRFIPEKNGLDGKPGEFETKAQALEIIKYHRAQTHHNIVYEVVEIIEEK